METYQQTCQRLALCIKRWTTRLMVFIIRGYQLLLSPWLGHHCRFHPTCSSYAVEAIEQHGPLRGLFLALVRLSKCHPWHRGGCDPVPLDVKTQHRTVNK